MGCVAPVYRPRDAEHTVLHQVIAEHLEAFLGAVTEAGDGAGLPQFVEREFREFLTRASICTPTCGCQRTIGRRWSVCAAMSCVRPLRRSACGCRATGASRWS